MVLQCLLQCYGAVVFWYCSLMMLQCYSAAVIWFLIVNMVFQCFDSLVLLLQTYILTCRATTRGPIGPLTINC